MQAVASKSSLLPVIGGRSVKAIFCRAGSDTWVEGAILDMTGDALWVVTSAPHVTGAIYLCKFRVGGCEIQIAVQRGKDPLCFELLPGSREALGDIAAAPRHLTA